MWMWLCVIFGTGVLGALAYFGMQYYGVWAKQRDEKEREQLAAEWKRRAAERKAKAEAGGLPATSGTSGEPIPPESPEKSGENPPMY
jgi:hypothetical protein